MKPTCTSEIIYTGTDTIVEQTKFGPYTKEVTIRVTAKRWTNYPGKTPEFTSYAVDTFWNGRLVEGHVTSTLPPCAR